MITARTIAVASLVAIAGLSGPATAARPTDPASLSPTATSRADRSSQRYCIETEQTGSRIPRRQCETLSGWQSQGIDPRLLPRRK